MNILNLAFNTINASKRIMPKGKISISNNIKLESMEDANIGVDKANTTLRIHFSFKSDYNPDFANIELRGHIIVLEEKEAAKKILSQWKKDKKIGKDFSATVINHVMNRCAIEVILMARELGLPSPIPLPKITANMPVKK